jgi:hypothetical protein
VLNTKTENEIHNLTDNIKFNILLCNTFKPVVTVHTVCTKDLVGKPEVK